MLDVDNRDAMLWPEWATQKNRCSHSRNMPYLYTHTHYTPQHIHTAHIAPLLTPVDYRTNNQHIIYQYIIMLEIEK